MPTLDSRCDMVTAHLIAAHRGVIRAVLCDASRWRAWLPGLRLVVHQDRGLAGVRWRVTRPPSGDG